MHYSLTLKRNPYTKHFFVATLRYISSEFDSVAADELVAQCLRLKCVNEIRITQTKIYVSANSKGNAAKVAHKVASKLQEVLEPEGSVVDHGDLTNLLECEIVSELLPDRRVYTLTFAAPILDAFDSSKLREICKLIHQACDRIYTLKSMHKGTREIVLNISREHPLNKDAQKKIKGSVQAIIQGVFSTLP